jgi:hypothetical protein
MKQISNSTSTERESDQNLLNSRWLPKLNLLVKATNHLFSKKNFRAVLVAEYISLIGKKISKIQDGAYIQHEAFLASFSRSSHIQKFQKKSPC